MSNYPPGVTGRELEIAGPDWEGDIERTCTATDIRLCVYTSDSDRHIRQIQSHRPATPQEILNACVVVEVAECPCIDQEVPAWSYEGVLHWECPVCGAEYTEDRFDVEDPDDKRDRMLDR